MLIVGAVQEIVGGEPPDHWGLHSRIALCKQGKTRRSALGQGRGSQRGRTWARVGQDPVDDLRPRVQRRIAHILFHVAGCCLLAIPLFAFSGLSVRATTKPAAPRVASTSIRITADTREYLDPCDCRAGILGGFPRRATMVGRLRPGLILDAGKTIAQASPYDLLRLRFIHDLGGERCGEVGYAALNVGRREAAFSHAELKRLANDSPVPLITATSSMASDAGCCQGESPRHAGAQQPLRPGGCSGGKEDFHAGTEKGGVGCGC
jgi:hypothetical protein